MSCYECQSEARNMDNAKLAAAIVKARSYMKSNNLPEIIIVKTVNGYGHRNIGDESLNRLTEVDHLLNM